MSKFSDFIITVLHLNLEFLFTIYFTSDFIKFDVIFMGTYSARIYYNSEMESVKYALKFEYFRKGGRW